jgi:hypothetical protein
MSDLIVVVRSQALELVVGLFQDFISERLRKLRAIEQLVCGHKDLSFLL